MIRGEKIILTELDRDNAETIRAWLNDPEVHRYLLVGHVPITKEQEQRFYAAQSESVTSFAFEIHLASDGTYLGNVGLRDVDFINRHAELGIVVGDKNAWGNGYGADAIVTCLRFAYLTLGLHRVFLKAHEDNARALDLYRRLGFVETGREREHVFSDGHFADYVVLDLLDREYRGLYCSNA
jgi:RimJ/RimL family protein N-acetyltransferase